MQLNYRPVNPAPAAPNRDAMMAMPVAEPRAAAPPAPSTAVAPAATNGAASPPVTPGESQRCKEISRLNPLIWNGNAETTKTISDNKMKMLAHLHKQNHRRVLSTALESNYVESIIALITVLFKGYFAVNTFH